MSNRPQERIMLDLKNFRCLVAGGHCIIPSRQNPGTDTVIALSDIGFNIMTEAIEDAREAAPVEPLKRLNSAMVFRTFGVACFSAEEQVPELQKSLLVLFAEQAERRGYDVDGLTIETNVGNFKLSRGEDGWNDVAL